MDRRITDLHQVARAGDVESVNRLLEEGADPNAVDAQGDTPLHAAMACQNPEIVTLLMDGGARPNTLNREGLTPLQLSLARYSVNYWAATKEEDVPAESLMALLARGARADIGDDIPYLLHKRFYAICPFDERFDEFVQRFYRVVLPELLKAGLDPNRRDITGRTLLHYCCAMRAPDPAPYINMLLEAGAEPTIKDRLGRTPLHLYANNRRFTKEGCLALMQAGADPCAADRNGRTPLHRFYAGGNHMDKRNRHDMQDKVDAFTESGATLSDRDVFGLSPIDIMYKPNMDNSSDASPVGRIMDMISRDDVDGLRNSIDKWGVHITNGDYISRTEKENPLLHLALHNPNPLHKGSCSKNCVDVMLDAGTDVNAVNSNGSTPLHIAVWSGNADMAEHLIARGADITARDMDGQTAIHYAVNRGERWHREYPVQTEGLIRLLMRMGADINARDKFGATPLHRSVRQHCPICSEILLRLGASPNHTDLLGQNAVYGVMKRGIFEYKAGDTLQHMTQVLQSRPATALLDHEGETPLTSIIRRVGLEYEIDAVITPMLAQGVDVNLTNRKGLSPLMVAVSKQLEVSLPLVEHLLGTGADPNAGQCCVSQMYRQLDEANKRETNWKVFKLKPVERRTLLNRLLQAGLDADAKDGNSQDTLLHMLCRYFAPKDDIALLLEHGPDVNSRNEDGETPLMLACRTNKSIGMESRLRILLEHDADVNLTDRHGKTAMDSLAETFGGLQRIPDNISELMLNYGASSEPAMGTEDNDMTIAATA